LMTLVRPGPAAPVAPTWTVTNTAIEQMQKRISANPADPVAYAAYANLGSLYLQKARETGDPSFYASAEQALRKSLELDGSNPLAAVTMGGLQLARHEFVAALEWGDKAVALAPYAHVAHGIRGDALVELGRYDEAIEAVQTMVDLRPDLSSLSRASYLRELHGDLPGAIEAMGRAVNAGNQQSEATNWARVQLGTLYFQTGDLAAAEREYRLTLANLPGYAPAQAGLGRVAAAKSDFTQAIEHYTHAAAVAPLPEYAAALAEVNRAAKNDREAAKQDELVRAMTKLQRAGGVDVDLDLALFEVDRAADRVAAERALETARGAHAVRPLSVHAADVLAWALYKAGRSTEALPYAREALRLGSQDAVTLYHAGAIALGAGDREAARTYLQGALAGNEQFHPRHAPEAKRLLEQLGR
ncbi:MAG TPA: tetratricopeptide repeat protein, partial [Chloroflexota bacterium]|nr:tetratricopeptide repeat protein [Chloroflexota bacterium]